MIYPGKLTREACFRIGAIGHLDSSDIEALIEAIREVLIELRCGSGGESTAIH